MNTQSNKCDVNEIGYHFINPHTVTILATYKCTAACQFCCFDSNPQIQKRIAYHQIEDFLEEALSLGSVQLVVFSGGECFLLGEDLVKAVQFAANKNVKVRCVSNGYWAKSLSSGRRILQRLVNAGLNELNISTGDYHQEWVSQETIINACVLGVESGLDNTLLVIEVHKERKVSAKQLLTDSRLSELKTNNAGRFGILESPWMPSKYDEIIEQEKTLFLNRDNVHKKKGCSNILNTIVLNPENNIGFCCGLTREKIPDLNTNWEKGKLSKVLEIGCYEFFKIWLHTDGPEKILYWASTKNPEIKWENRYSHHCHACLALWEDPLVKEVILNHYQERVQDVLIRYRVLHNNL